jgi:hypothetical protein
MMVEEADGLLLHKSVPYSGFRLSGHFSFIMSTSGRRGRCFDAAVRNCICEEVDQGTEASDCNDKLLLLGRLWGRTRADSAVSGLVDLWGIQHGCFASTDVCWKVRV